MRYSFTILFFFGALGGFTVKAQQVKPISLEEALSFEKNLQAAVRQPIPMVEKLYTQPVNKKTPCKLPTSSDQIARTNFKAYWDGQCKNGFAFGLGRDIAISDTHHLEEITVHDGTGSHFGNSAKVLYDFVRGEVNYMVPGPEYPTMVFLKEYLSIAISGLNIYYEAGKVDKEGNRQILQFSPFMRWRTFYNIDQRVVYKFTNDTLSAFAEPAAPTAIAEVLDPKTGSAGGVAMVVFGKNQVEHFMVEGPRKIPVIAPADYVTHLNNKLSEVNSAVASAKVDRAQQLEREYLYFACNGKHSIDGLDKNISSKICTWRDQFKSPYESASNKYQLELEQLKRKAELAEQQRQIRQQQLAASRQADEQQRIVQQQRAEQQRIAQQQLAAQHNALNRQQSQQEMRDLVNGISQWGHQMQNAGQQMLQSVQRHPGAHTNMPFIPLGGSSINCVTISLVTNCR